MSFALIGRMLANRTNLAPKDPEYPLWRTKVAEIKRARLGGMLDFTAALATFITAEASGALFKAPPVTSTIDACGKVDDGDFTIHRFYFSDYLLQIITGSDDLIVPKEIKLFQKLAGIEPSTAEEWDLWIKGVDGNQPLLTGPTIKWQNETEYTRAWSPGNGAAQAKRHVENVTVGDEPSVITINAMLFSRALKSGQTEWLQLAMCRSDNERWIEAYVGLNLESGEISAI